MLPFPLTDRQRTYRACILLSLFVNGVDCFLFSPGILCQNSCHPARLSPLFMSGRNRPRRVEDNRSLGEKMFGDVFGGLKNLAGIEDPSDVEEDPDEIKMVDAGDAIRKIDQRAVDGSVTYDDFLVMGQTFRELKGKTQGLPEQLSSKQIKETEAKFARHEKIVGAMLEEERKNPDLMKEDLNDTDNNCPRVQRLSKDSGVSERDVALFIAEFEAMRQSTQRIAAGEDPEAVNLSLEQGSGNRAERRKLKRIQEKASKNMMKKKAAKPEKAPIE